MTENQKERIRNLEAIQASASLIGLVAGIIYAKKTGGGFWRYVGWSFAGSLALGLPALLATTPAKNKILREADDKKSTTSEPNATKEQFDRYVSVQKASGDDMFRGISSERSKQLQNDWVKNLTRSEADVFITLGSRKEKNFTTAEKNKMDVLLKKWSNG